MTTTLREAWCSTSAGRLHYRVAAPVTAHELPLVLVHGLGVSSAYFARLQPRLASTRAVYAVDLPGRGRSTGSASPAHSVPEFATALETWLVACRLAKVDLFGHSLGGQVVTELAGRRPDLVSRVILAAPTLGWRDAGLLALCANLIRDGVREPLSLYRAILPAYARCGPRRMARIDARAAGNDLAAMLQRVAQPVLVVRGARDSLFRPDELATLRAAMPDLTVVEVPGAAHALHWSHPEAVATAVEAFLAGTVPAREEPPRRVLAV